MMAKKRLHCRAKIDFCPYEIHVKCCTALQLLGMGGEDAAIMAEFLDTKTTQIA
jgi:hypothetical protein